LNLNRDLLQAIKVIKESKHLTAFTGAGISVESGIPPFRGTNGIWNKYDPDLLELNRFFQNPEKSWLFIKEIFYNFFSDAEPNPAHLLLSNLEEKKILKSVITQNIDHLHQKAGSKNVIEFHGGSGQLICISCGKKTPALAEKLIKIPPICEYCGNILKPDFIFFGEAIPEKAYKESIKQAKISDVMLIIGTTGQVMPACRIPIIAKENGCIIIEINNETSSFTNRITDFFLQGKAGEISKIISEKMIL